jgi:hypothetical protein
MTYPQQPGDWQQNQQPWPQDPAQQASVAPVDYSGYAGYGAPQDAAYPNYGYQTPILVAAAPRTNPLAIASLVCALTGLALCGVPSVVGAILGHVARRQIRERGEAGDGLALAGIICGWIIFGLMLLFGIGYVGLIAYAINQDSTYNTNFFRTAIG